MRPLVRLALLAALLAAAAAQAGGMAVVANSTTPSPSPPTASETPPSESGSATLSQTQTQTQSLSPSGSPSLTRSPETRSGSASPETQSPSPETQSGSRSPSQSPDTQSESRSQSQSPETRSWSRSQTQSLDTQSASRSPETQSASLSPMPALELIDVRPSFVLSSGGNALTVRGLNFRSDCSVSMEVGGFRAGSCRLQQSNTALACTSPKISSFSQVEEFSVRVTNCLARDSAEVPVGVTVLPDPARVILAPFFFENLVTPPNEPEAEDAWFFDGFSTTSQVVSLVPGGSLCASRGTHWFRCRANDEIVGCSMSTFFDLARLLSNRLVRARVTMDAFAMTNRRFQAGYATVVAQVDFLSEEWEVLKTSNATVLSSDLSAITPQKTLDFFERQFMAPQGVRYVMLKVAAVGLASGNATTEVGIDNVQLLLSDDFTTTPAPAPSTTPDSGSAPLALPSDATDDVAAIGFACGSELLLQLAVELRVNWCLLLVCAPFVNARASGFSPGELLQLPSLTPTIDPVWFFVGTFVNKTTGDQNMFFEMLIQNGCSMSCETSGNIDSSCEASCFVGLVYYTASVTVTQTLWEAPPIIEERPRVTSEENFDVYVVTTIAVSSVAVIAAGVVYYLQCVRPRGRRLLPATETSPLIPKSFEPGSTVRGRAGEIVYG